jgi:hypothetical protein
LQVCWHSYICITLCSVVELARSSVKYWKRFQHEGRAFCRDSLSFMSHHIIYVVHDFVMSRPTKAIEVDH